MGNDASTGGQRYQEASQYGGVYFQMDEAVAFPDQTLKGTVYLNLQRPYPGDKICFAIKGNEYTKWVDKEPHQRQRPDGTMETYYVDVTREGKQEILNNELTIYDWANGAIIPPGQYSFPISFRLPMGLPGSFFFQGVNIIAEIAYSVRAYLKPENDKIPKLEYKVPITIRETLNKNIQTQEIKLNKPLKTWCCCDQGTLNMRTAFEKNAYAPGEEARILTEVDNSKCSLMVQDVRFSLVQTIHLSAGPHGRQFHNVISSISLGSIQPGETCLGENVKKGVIQLPPGHEGSSKQFRGDGPLPDYNSDSKSMITPSCHGRLVKSDFALTVSCSMDGCLCCDSDPVNSIGIQIYSSAQKMQAPPQPPSGWKPQEMPMANLTITIVQRADGGQDIHIDTGAPGPNPGMANNQMPPQNFGQPNNFGNPNMMNNSMGSNQPMMNNSMNAPMNNGMYGGPQQPQMMSQQGYNQGYGQPQPMNPQMVNVGPNQNQYNPHMQQGY